jgi:CRP-like cAMP-binding protein
LDEYVEDRAYSVRSYGDGDGGKQLLIHIGDAGLDLTDPDDESYTEHLQFSRMASYDLGGSLGADGSANNSLIILMKPEKNGGPLTRRELGTVAAQEILNHIAATERRRVTDQVQNTDSIMDVLKGLDIPPQERTDTVIGTLHNFFKDSILFGELTELQQFNCCRYFKRVSLRSKHEVLFEQGDTGDEFFTVVMGKVGILINGHEVRQKGQGESFGEVALQEGGAERNATIVALGPCELASLSSADYLRICGNLEEVVWPILDLPPAERTEMQLQLVLAYFERVPFLLDLPYPLLQIEACRMIKKKFFDQDDVVFEIGAPASCMYIVGRGTVTMKRSMEEKEPGESSSLVRKIIPGSCFGEEALQEETEPSRKYTATADATGVIGNRCLCASLSLTDFHTACQTVGIAAMQVLRRPPRLRKDADMNMLLHIFQGCQFFQDLSLPAIRLNVCRFLGVMKLEQNEVLYEQGQKGDKFYAIMMGQMTVEVDGKRLGRRHPGEGCGEEELRSRQTKRKATIKASEPCILATLTRNDYNRVMKMASVKASIAKYWDLLTHPNFPEMLAVDFNSYRELHLRIGKTCIRGHTPTEAEAAVIADWHEDLAAHAHKGGADQQLLSYQGFSDALYMLVDDWSESVGPAELFIDFLETTFENITCIGGAEANAQGEIAAGRKLKPLDEIKSKYKTLAKMQKEGVRKGKADAKLAALESSTSSNFNAAEADDRFTQAVVAGARKTQSTKRISFKLAASTMFEAFKLGNIVRPTQTVNSHSEETDYDAICNLEEPSVVGEHAEHRSTGVASARRMFRNRALWALVTSCAERKDDVSESEPEPEEESTPRHVFLDDASAQAEREGTNVELDAVPEWTHPRMDGSENAVGGASGTVDNAPGTHGGDTKNPSTFLHLGQPALEPTSTAANAPEPADSISGAHGGDARSRSKFRQGLSLDAPVSPTSFPLHYKPQNQFHASQMSPLPTNGNRLADNSEDSGSHPSASPRDRARDITVGSMPAPPSPISLTKFQNGIFSVDQRRGSGKHFDRKSEARYSVNMTIRVPPDWEGAENSLCESPASLQRLVMPQLAETLNVHPGDVVVKSMNARIIESDAQRMHQRSSSGGSETSARALQRRSQQQRGQSPRSSLHLPIRQSGQSQTPPRGLSPRNRLFQHRCVTATALGAPDRSPRGPPPQPPRATTAPLRTFRRGGSSPRARSQYSPTVRPQSVKKPRPKWLLEEAGGGAQWKILGFGYVPNPDQQR